MKLLQSTLICDSLILFYEEVSIGGKIPTAMTLLKVASDSARTAQIPIVHIANGQSTFFCLFLRSPMNFTDVFVFYPCLAFANPAVGRLSAATVTEANKVSLTVSFDGAVSFFVL